jgi:hypothetical protein
MMVSTFRAFPMWCTYATSTTMLTSTRANDTITVSPGTDPFCVNDRTSRMASIACTNVPTKIPIAN